MAMLRSLMLFFIIFSMGNAKVEKCPHGWTKFKLQCFKFYSQEVDWITAERNCQSLKANLASVHNKRENDFLLSLLPSSSTRSWLGGHDGEQEDQWLWSDGTVYDFTNWNSGEPNNGLGSGVENCMEISYDSSNFWNDAPCSSQISYICATDL